MIKIVAVGRIKEASNKALIDEYVKRLTGYTKIEICEVNDLSTNNNNSVADNEIIKDKEGVGILTRIKDNEYVILLDLRGKMYDSCSLAQHIDELFTMGSSNLTFVIGGSLGVSKQVQQRANEKWKISDLTFPHQIVRLLVVEQLYRCYKINRHEPYHK